MSTNLSFTPKHWQQTEDGNWMPGPTSGTSHGLLGLVGGRVPSDPFARERMEEMQRIVSEGGSVITLDPKGDLALQEQTYNAAGKI